MYERACGVEWAEKRVKCLRNTYWQFCFLVKLLKVLAIPAIIHYRFKVNNKNTKRRCKNMFKFNNKDTQRRHWNRSDIFNAKFDHISRLLLVFLLLALSMYLFAGMKQLSQLRWKLFLVIWIKMLPELQLMLLLVTIVLNIWDLTKVIS